MTLRIQTVGENGSDGLVAFGREEEDWPGEEPEEGEVADPDEPEVEAEVVERGRGVDCDFVVGGFEGYGGVAAVRGFFDEVEEEGFEAGGVVVEDFAAEGEAFDGVGVGNVF